jgi:hypothetical protein
MSAEELGNKNRLSQSYTHFIFQPTGLMEYLNLKHLKPTEKLKSDSNYYLPDFSSVKIYVNINLLNNLSFFTPNMIDIGIIFLCK